MHNIFVSMHFTGQSVIIWDFSRPFLVILVKSKSVFSPDFSGALQRGVRRILNFDFLATSSSFLVVFGHKQKSPDLSGKPGAVQRVERQILN